MRIALTGSIACGKTLFVQFLRELGENVLDADDVVRELESPGGRAVPQIEATFGKEVVAPEGGIDRRHLASLVFGDGEETATRRRRLEGILHPLVRERLRAFDGICVVPLLYESGWACDFDKVIAIGSPREIQIARMRSTRGYTAAEAESRLAAQIPAEEKLRRADYAVVNDSTPEVLRLKAAECHTWLETVRRK